MVQSFSLNANNDIFIGTDGNLSIATGLSAVEFACKNFAQAQLNEMIFEYDQGVAYFETIWQNTANVAQFEASLRAALSNVPGVTGISNLTITVANNQLNYVATIQTIYGTGNISNVGQ
jgi:hypothetical protein